MILCKEIFGLHGVVSETPGALEAFLVYESPHSSPSRGSIPSRRRQRDRSAQGSSWTPAPTGAGRPGRRVGHSGVLAHRKAGRTVRHGVSDGAQGAAAPVGDCNALPGT